MDQAISFELKFLALSELGFIDAVSADDLGLSSRELERLRAAQLSEQPLREIWSICVHTSDARLISEFMALANRIEGLRREVVA